MKCTAISASQFVNIILFVLFSNFNVVVIKIIILYIFLLLIS